MKKDIDSIYDGFVIKTTGEVIGNLEVDKKSFTSSIGKTNGENYYKLYNDPKTIRYHNFSKELNEIIQQMPNDVINYLDLRAITFPLSFEDTLYINKKLVVLLPNSDITFNNKNTDQNMIEVTSDYCCIVGNNVNSLVFIEENDSLKGYHIASYTDITTLIIENVTLKGKKSSLGVQYESINYPINGSGGVYKENGKLVVKNSTIYGTKVSGIYVQNGVLTAINNNITNTGGDGIFCNNCKQSTIKHNTITNCNMAGISLLNTTNTVSESNNISNTAIGEFIRTSSNITLSTNTIDYIYNKGSNPWEDSSNDTNNVGFNLVDSNNIAINDVIDSTKSKYIGKGQVIIDSEYIYNVNNKISNIGLEDKEISENSTFIEYINTSNSKLHKPYLSMVEEDHDRKNDITIDSDSKTIEVIWSPKNYGITTKTTNEGFTTDSTITDPLYFGCTESYLMTETDSYLDGKRLIVNHQPVTFDRDNGRIGINNDSPEYTIDNVGTLHSTKLVQFDDTLTVDKDVLFKSNLEVDLDTLIKGSVTINTDLHTLRDSNLDGDVIIGKTLDVKDDTTLEGNLDVKLDSILEGALTVTKATVLKDTLEVDSDTSLKAKLDVTGSTTLNDTLTVSKSTILNDTLEVSKTLTVQDTSTIQDLNVQGLTTSNNDIIINDKNKGFILIDRNNNKQYRLYIEDDTLGIEEV